MKRPNIIISTLHLLGIVTLRFKPVPRIWATWLMTINLACVAFLSHIEGQVALAAAGAAVLAMAAIYQRQRFTRLLGICHIIWVPMIAWLVSRWDSIQTDPMLATYPAYRTGPERAAVEAAAEAILSARTPLIVCGGGGERQHRSRP